MLPADLFLALRYLKPKRNFISAITLLTLCGPAFGVAFLLIVLSIMTGFDKEIRSRLLDMQAHFNIFPAGYAGERVIEKPDEVLRELKKLGLKAAPVIDGPVLIQRGKEALPRFARGIDPKLEMAVTKIDPSNVTGRLDVGPGEVAIGESLARELGVWVNPAKPDKILVHSPGKLARNFDVNDQDGSISIKEKKEVYLPEELTVVGIFSTGVYDFDSKMILIQIDQAAELFGMEWGTAATIHGIVENPFDMQRELQAMKDALPACQIRSWQENNRTLFAALQNEKGMMFFVLSFMVLIAAFAICSVMITAVVQKTREIGVLKAVGFTPLTIARIFVIQGFIFGIAGAVLGIGLGIAVVLNRDHIVKIIEFVIRRPIFPPEQYHLLKIPAILQVGDMAAIALMSITLCTLAALIPALYASALKPANALQDGN
jgi:lipoprotein-releasing system permease protein